MAAQRTQQQQQQPSPEKPSHTAAAAADGNASVPDARLADSRGPSAPHLVNAVAQLLAWTFSVVCWSLPSMYLLNSGLRCVSYALGNALLQCCVLLA